MFKKHFHKIVLLLTTLGITSLQAAGLPETQETEGKDNDDNNHTMAAKPAIEYQNHTLQYSKKEVENSIHPDELEDEKEYFRDNNIALKIKEKKGAVFFLMITSHKETEALNKFFFFNRDPNEEKAAIKRVNLFYKCHVISHTKPMVSPHIIVQVLGWLAQNASIYTPLFIYSNGPLCTTCHALVHNLFNLNMPTNEKGCNGARDVELANICPLAQRYINSRLTVALAQKILLPKVSKAHENQLQQIAKDKDNIIAEKGKQIKELTKKFSDQIKVLKGFLKDKASLPCAPLICDAGYVWRVAVTNDNKYIVTGNYDPTIRIWDFDTGKEVHYSPLKGHIEPIQSVAVTKDNRYIVSGSGSSHSRKDCTIRIWDFNTGKEVSYSPLNGHEGPVCSVAISSDNRYIVSGSGDNTIRIWDFNTGKEVGYSPLIMGRGYCFSIVVTKDNQYIVGGFASPQDSPHPDNTIRIWHFNTGKEVGYSPLKGHTSTVLSIAVTHDNKYIVSLSYRTIRIWDFKTGKEMDYSPFNKSHETMRNIAITNDNLFIVGGCDDGTICIWDFKTGKEVNYSRLKGHTRHALQVAVTKDNKYIVSGSADNTIRIWDLKLLRYLYEDDQREVENKEDNGVDNAVFDID